MEGFHHPEEMPCAEARDHESQEAVPRRITKAVSEGLTVGGAVDDGTCHSAIKDDGRLKRALAVMEVGLIGRSMGG